MTETNTETVTETNTETVTETNTETVTETNTETVTETNTETVTETNTETVTETNTETVTETNTETVTQTNTETATETNTETETETVTETNTETVTESYTETETLSSTETPSTTATVTSTETPTDTLSASPTSTATPSASASPSSTLSPTGTVTSTRTVSSTVTSAPTKTVIPTAVCPAMPDTSFAGAGQIALQCGGSVGRVFRFDPVTNQFHYVGAVPSPLGAGLAVDPDDPSHLLLNYGFHKTTAANIGSMDAAGNHSTWGTSALFTPQGGAFSPLTRDYWVTTTAGKLLRFRHNDHSGVPDTYNAAIGGSNVGLGMGIVFDELGNLYFDNGAYAIYKVSAEALAAPGLTLTASLVFNTSFYALYDLAYDGHGQIYGLCLIGPGFGGVMRFQLSNGAVSFVKTDLAPFYRGSGSALGQGQAISIGLDGYLWVMQAPSSNPYSGLAQIDPVSGDVLQVVAIPTVVDGLNMSGPVHMAVMGLRLPHQSCSASTPTSVVTVTSTPTLSATPSMSPTPSLTPVPCDGCNAQVASRSVAKEGVNSAWLAPGDDLMAVPNPNHGQATVAFRLEKAGNARLTLVDLAGEVVWQKTIEGLPEGESHAEMDLAAMASGVYVLVLEGEGDFGMKRLGSFKVAVVH